jgi:hypothetical protein
MNNKFVEYVENEIAPEQSYGLMGIASVLVHDGKELNCYAVQKNKEGNGFYIVPFSKKMNNRWFKTSELDSKFDNEELTGLIRKNVSAHYSNKGNRDSVPKKEAAFDDSCPF